MAIDSTSKRFSMMSHVMGDHIQIIVPSGTVTAGDRQTYLSKYGGILWASLVAGQGSHSVSPWYWWWTDNGN